MLFHMALKNIKGNAGGSLSYIISMIICVLIYFSLASLEFNSNIQDALGSDIKTKALFKVGLIMVTVFAVIFIYYSTSYFLKQRKKEIGLYMLFGIRKTQVALMVFLEVTVTGIIAMAIGVLAGSGLNYFIMLAIQKFVGIPGSLFDGINAAAVFITVAAFILMFIITAVLSSFSIYKSQLLDLFRADEKEEAGIRVNKAGMITGMICLAVSYAALFHIRSGQSFATAEILSVILSVPGTFLVYRNLLPYVFERRRKKNSYLDSAENMMKTSTILHRIRNNYRIWAVLSLIISGIVLIMMVGTTMLNSFVQKDEYLHPFTYSYVNQGTASQNRINKIMSSRSSNKVLYHGSFRQTKVNGRIIGVLGLSNEYNADSFYMISESQLKKISAGYGKFFNCSLDSSKEIMALGDDNNIKGKYFIADSGNARHSFKISEINRINPLILNYDEIVFVAKDNVFDKYFKTNTSRSVEIYNNKAPYDSAQLTLKLQNVLPVKADLNYSYEDAMLENFTKLVFIMALMLSLIFMSALGAVLLIKSIKETGEDKNRYIILHKLGMPLTAIRKTVKAQAGTMFKMPLVIGTLNILVNLIAMAKINLLWAPGSAAVILTSAGSFLAIYLLYYLITCRISWNAVRKACLER